MFQFLKTIEKQDTFLIKMEEYFTTIISIKDPILETGWGWFVDIDIESHEQPKNVLKLSNTYQNTKKQKQISLQTIKECHSIRSMKSLHNLQDISEESYVFYGNNNINDKINTTSICYSIIIHIIGFTTLIFCYLIICKK